MDLPLAIAVVTFLTVMLASSALFLYLNPREAVQTWRRRAEGNHSAAEDEATRDGLAGELMTQLRALLEWFGRLNQPSKSEEVRATKRLLVTAGYRGRKAPIMFLGARLLSAIVIVVPLAMIPVKLLGFPTVTNLLLLYVVGAACGYYAPKVWLTRAIAARKDALQRGIPDSLDLMVVCVEAGLGLDQAIARVGEEIKRTHPAL